MQSIALCASTYSKPSLLTLAVAADGTHLTDRFVGLFQSADTCVSSDQARLSLCTMLLSVNACSISLRCQQPAMQLCLSALFGCLQNGLSTNQTSGDQGLPGVCATALNKSSDSVPVFAQQTGLDQVHSEASSIVPSIFSMQCRSSKRLLMPKSFACIVCYDEQRHHALVQHQMSVCFQAKVFAVTNNPGFQSPQANGGILQVR